MSKADSNWSLGDAVARSVEAPFTFWVPSSQAIDQLRRGNLVKLIFCSHSNDPDAGAERMWVEIESSNGARFTGILTNSPKFIPNLDRGARIEFEARHIADLDIADPTANEFERYFARCFVTHRILEAREKPQYVYREMPDSDEDSGWRIFVGDETDEYVEDPANSSYVAVGVVLNIDPSLLTILDQPDGCWVWDAKKCTWEPEADNS